MTSIVHTIEKSCKTNESNNLDIEPLTPKTKIFFIPNATICEWKNRVLFIFYHNVNVNRCALSSEIGTPVLNFFFGSRVSFVVAKTCLCPTIHARTKLMESLTVGALLEVGLKLCL